MQHINRFLILSFLILLTRTASGQSLPNRADREFSLANYALAAPLYEEAVAAAKTPIDQQRLLERLADSYRHLRDTPNAERVYGQLLNLPDLPNDLTANYLYYAQALAGNGKFRESQAAYEKYLTWQSQLKTSLSAANSFQDTSEPADETASYRVDFLKINTGKAEFSPMFYRDGLVYVSANGATGGLKRTFNVGNVPFLDLLYVPNRAALTRNEATKTKRGRRSSLGGLTVGQRLGLDTYTSPTSNDSKTMTFLSGSDLNAGVGYATQPVTEASRFNRTLNTKYHEGPATFSHDGSRIYFTRNNFNNGEYRQSRDGVNKLKLYTAAHTNGTWQPSEELSFNSDEYSVGHPALSKDDQRLYFASDMPGGFGGTDIYVARWENGRWGKPTNLGAGVNSKGNELFPYIDERDGLYYSSDGRKGLGGLDIFFAPLTATGDEARQVMALGEPFNSDKDDFGLITDGDRKTGYFSSNRKNGGQDDDLYAFTRQTVVRQCRELTFRAYDADTRQPLANVRVAVKGVQTDSSQYTTNDAGQVRFCVEEDNDFQFVTQLAGYLDGQVGLSTKALTDDQPLRLAIGLSKPTIVAATDVPNLVAGARVLRGRATAQANGQPLPGVTVLLRNLTDNTTQRLTTGPDGSYTFDLQPKTPYALDAELTGYASLGNRIAPGATGPADLTLFRMGDIVTVNNVYYDRNRYAIRPDAARELDRVVAVMLAHPAMRIELRSHTDSRSSAVSNKKLSVNRAKAATAYLVKKGVAKDRMMAAGYGETLLLNDCKDGVRCAENLHQQNRRTEIKILNLD